MNNTLEITLEHITKHLNTYLENKKESDIRITHDNKIFLAEIYSGSHKVNTGLGGLKMFFNNLGNDISFFKVEYNGKILNKEEKEGLIVSISK